MEWERHHTGFWLGEHKNGQATILRHGPIEPNRKRHRWYVNIIVANPLNSTWAVLGSIPAAKRYAERFIDKHTW